MQSEFHKVAQFHQLIGAFASSEPRLLPCDRGTAALFAERLRGLCQDIATLVSTEDCLAQRVLMSLEETSEWLEAHAANDLQAAQDAWGDRCYLLLGDAVSGGLAVDSIFQAIHVSNMTKRGVDPATGKAIKSQDYQKPQLS